MLDELNVTATLLLDNCADSRIANSVTQLTTKYNALQSLAKDVFRRLEVAHLVSRGGALVDVDALVDLNLQIGGRLHWLGLIMNINLLGLLGKMNTGVVRREKYYISLW